MSAVFESETLGPIERLIMLALADHADDAGRCYPSNARLQSRTGLSERAVRQNVRKLTEAGFLDVHIGVGQGGANVYIVRPLGGQEMPPAPDAPGISCPSPRHIVPLGGAPNAPKPSGTIKEPSKDNTRECVDILSTVVRTEVAIGFIEHRKAKKAKLTPHAAELIAKKLRTCPDPEAAIERSIMNGWTGVFPETERNAQSSHASQQHGSSQGRPNRVDPALEQIARLTGLSQASGNGRP